MAEPDPRHPSTTGRQSRFSPLSVGLALAVCLTVAKVAFVTVRPGVVSTWAAPMVSYQDVLFALCLGLVGELFLRVAAARPLTSALWRFAFTVFAVVCAVYSLIAVGVFDYFGRPLTYDMLRLMRNLGPLKSSLIENVTRPVVVAAITAPIAAIATVLAIGGRRKATILAIIVAVAWVLSGLWQSAQQPVYVRLRPIVLSPHVELIRSVAAVLTHAQRATLPKDFAPEDTIDFQTFATRSPGPPVSDAPLLGNARPKNVILVVLESVGTKYLSLYGSRYPTTPHLAAEAATALVFDGFYANAPYTWASFLAINYAVYPGMPWRFAGVERSLPLNLASVLQQHGWRTAYLHNGNLDWAQFRWMVEGHGFSTVEDCTDWKVPRITSWGAEDRYLFDRLIRWIDEKPGQPFFTVCWTDQTHDPYALPAGVSPPDFFQGDPPRELAPELARYLTIVQETDRQLGRLFAALRERRLDEDTLVIVTGDHGEAFRDPHDQRGHSFSVYDEEVKVPLMLWNPRLFPSGRRVSDIGGHVDLSATIANVLGIDPPGEWQGHSLFDAARPLRTFSMAHSREYLFSVREDRWKYIFDANTGAQTLFDLASDPTEQTNLAANQSALCDRFRQRVAGWVSFEDEFLRPRRPSAGDAGK